MEKTDNKKQTFLEKHPNAKKVTIEILVVLVFVCISVVCFSIAVKSCANLAGWNTIVYPTAYNPPTATTKDVSFNYYLDSSDGIGIQEKKQTIRNKYGEMLEKLYRLCDEIDDYSANAVISIGYLNNHLNEEVVVDSILFNILKDAYNKTLENNNYSIFAQPLMDYWANIAMDNYVNEYPYQDPINEVENANYITDLVSLIKDLNHASITFNDEKYSVKINASEQLIDFLDGSRLLGLNVLKDSYCLDYIANSIINMGYTKGYITKGHELCINLGANPEKISDGEYQYFYYNNSITTEGNEYLQSSYVDVNSKASKVYLHTYAVENVDLGSYYQINNINRHPYVNVLDGYPNNVFETVMNVSNTLTLYDVFYQTMNEFSMSKDDALNYIENSPMISLAKFNENNNVFYGNYDVKNVATSYFLYNKIGG